MSFLKNIFFLQNLFILTLLAQNSGDVVYVKYFESDYENLIRLGIEKLKLNIRLENFKDDHDYKYSSVWN